MPADLRNAASERARVLAIQQARALYSDMRSVQIMTAREAATVDSNYTYRDYLKLMARVNGAKLKLRSLSKSLSSWQTKQAQNMNAYISQVEDALRELG